MLVCLVGVWVRLLGVGSLPMGQFTETDAYLYVHQATIVSAEGQLPARDMRRWVPLGRDTRQSLNLYPIVLGYVHKVLRLFFPGVSVSTVVAYAPVCCFGLCLLGLCVFLAGTQGFRISLSVGLILATLPGTIERSAYGFGDRDAWCLLLGVSAVLTYLLALRVADRTWRFLWRFFSGFLMFLGGLSWEGFGVFLGIVVCVEMWRFLACDTEPDLGGFAVWVLSFVPWLWLFSPAYRQGVGWATHLSAFMLLPPVAILAVRLLRYWLFERAPVREPLGPYRRQISLVLLLVCLSLGGIYLLSIRETFSLTTVPFGDSRLLRSIGELAVPHFGYWPYRYGSLFLTGSLGLSLMPLWHWGRAGHRLSASLAVFCLMVFFRHPVAGVFGAALADAFFWIAGGAVGMALGHVGYKRPESALRERSPASLGVDISLLAWAVFWLALARDIKRYDFFIGVALAYFTATLIYHVATRVSETLRNPKWTTPAFHEKLKQLFLNEVSMAALLLWGVLLWGPIGGGHIFRASAAATHLRHVSPGRGALAETYAWMQANLPSDAVVAAEWSYGTQLNVLGGVRTITGPDHYLPYWIQLYHRYVEQAKNEQEVIDFLFAHDATHLMITREKHPEKTLVRSGTLSGIFVPRYPAHDFSRSPVKVWELRYPAGLEKRQQYVSTAPLKGETLDDSESDHRH